MLNRRVRLGLLLSLALMAASCGGGDVSPSTTSTGHSSTLTAIAVSPLTFALPPGATQQLTVTGTYSDGTSTALAASDEKFVSSNSAVATVDGSGLVTVLAGAQIGATASISVTDIASGIATSSGAAAVVTVAAPTLKAIALSPSTFTLVPGATQQLVVTATYSDGTTGALAAADETFTSSNSAVATVSAAGLVSVAAGAATGATATIEATNSASGVSTTSTTSALVTVAATPLPKLVSITLSPLTFAAAPGATQPLSVMGTYSDGTTASLAASGEVFASSNTAVATVSAAGVVAITSGAVVGATATIGVTDTATGVAALAGHTTLVTATTPAANSLSAATATALDNPLCAASIAPFYWEIGDRNGALASGSVGTSSSGPVVGSTTLAIASASKMLYASYVTQVRGAASKLSASDIDFLHFTSGYTNMGDSASTATCPPTLSPDSIDQCLTLSNSSGAAFSAQDPATTGEFDYDSGHMENHASQLTALGNVAVTSLGPTISAQLGTGVSFVYSEPLMAGGVVTTGSMYALVLRNILNGSLAIRDALGTSPVCTVSSSTCVAGYTPFPQEAWHYAIGGWVEDNPATHGDGAFSSAGAFGFYPWIDASKSYYGIISRLQIDGTGAYPSVRCGRLIRKAFMTGVEQTGTLPTG